MTTATNGTSPNPPPRSYWERKATDIYTHAVKPIFAGMAYTSIITPIEIAASYTIHVFLKDKKVIKDHPYLEISFSDMAIIAPIFEEIVFRVLIHVPISWFVTTKVSDEEISFGIGSYRCTMKKSQLITSIASGVLFGSLHYFVAKSVTQTILNTVTGIGYGILKEKYGLLAPISAHMTNNATLFGLLYFFYTPKA
jgi:membrane protease YdiL (CAAX protease family)